MNFKRREWIHLATAALCGCKERKAAPVLDNLIRSLVVRRWE